MATYTAWIIGEIKQGETLKALHAKIGNAKEGDDVYVNIISEGGDVFEGKDIYNYLKQSPANVYTIAKGTVASIATLIQLGAPKANRMAAPNALPLIHNPWGETQGDASAHLQRAIALQQVEDELIDIYSSETGTSREVIAEAMKINDFMPLDKYMELGFVSKITEPIKAVAHLQIENQQNPNTNSIMTTIEKKLDTFFAKISAKLGIKNEFTEAPKALLMTLQDGTTNINVATESDMPEVGNAVTMEDGSAAADGDYTLADGTVLTVVGGVITAVVEPVVDTESEEVKALKAENETLKNQVSEMEAKMETYAKSMEEIQAKLEATYTPPSNRKPAFRAAAPKDTKQNMFSKEDLKRKPTK